MFNLPKEIVILDLEITTWEGAIQRRWSGEGEHMEVIQMGAAKVETDNFETLDTFNCFVRPRVNPILSEYCKELTGIKQEQVDSAEEFPVFIKEFAEWCGDLSLYCYGKIKKIPTMLDREAIIENSKLASISSPFTEDKFNNINLIFHKHGYNVRQSGSTPEAFGLKLQNRPHNAMNDVNGLITGLKALKKAVSN
ncbi:MAG: 3'-5' exonuclease [Candidatus Pacebacteria bacterium]|jgi:inhibitor of KinA sporulation pathway (predicted exonuclease)|nr:hypothetical protein [bacterium]MDP6527900.1 3'-5' exonuclease [Candidatus Paceibacterota bacterium]MDP6659710.1 3'-5' exonuclease [Candidatus Paceibacterota bacterium]|tara:strand:- start:16693 stop:17277 length:585 start_codon:yes stop_codon:yes gene_type:complete